MRRDMSKGGDVPKIPQTLVQWLVKNMETEHTFGSSLPELAGAYEDHDVFSSTEELTFNRHMSHPIR